MVVKIILRRIKYPQKRVKVILAPFDKMRKNIEMNQY